MKSVRNLVLFSIYLLTVGIFLFGCGGGTSSGCNEVDSKGVVADTSVYLYIHNDSTESGEIPGEDQLNDITTPSLGSWLAVGPYGIIYNSIDGGDHWAKQASGTQEELNAVSNPDINAISVAVGANNTVIRSTNSGFTWENAVVRADRHVSLNAVATVSGYGVIVGDHGLILRSANSQYLWDTAASPVSAHLHGVCFVTPSKVIAVGSEGTIIGSEDGGYAWQKINNPANQNVTFYGVASAGQNTVIAVGYQLGPQKRTILRSTDAGATWSYQSNGGVTDGDNATPLYSVSHGLNNWWIAGERGRIFKSTDQGLTWFDINSQVAFARLTSIRMIGDEQGFAVGRADD